MTRDQLDLIPDRLLVPRERNGCRDLIDWLHARGWQMTLQELDEERRGRGLLRPQRRRTRTMRGREDDAA